MPEFVMPFRGDKDAAAFHALDEFTQGYVSAMFFTESDSESFGRDLDEPRTFADLHPATLVAIVNDCARFLADAGAMIGYRDEEAGRDFWYTRNGHGAGFRDGDWDDSGHADSLTDMAKEYGACEVYTGDDGMIYIMGREPGAIQPGAAIPPAWTPALQLADSDEAGGAAVERVLKALPGDGRSNWYWLRLPNGDLVLCTFPQGDTYESVEQVANAAPYREG